jgi:hypothetical protein
MLDCDAADGHIVEAEVAVDICSVGVGSAEDGVVDYALREIGYVGFAEAAF